MRAVGLQVHKNNLSEYVRTASGGKTILTTDRDRVVAERSGFIKDALRAEAVREGWLSPPALPGAWPNGSVSGLRARGGFEVSMVWKNAELTAATVRSIRGGKCRVRYRDRIFNLGLAEGESLPLKLRD